MNETELTIRASWDTPEGIETITQTVAKGASPAELAMFLEVCRGTGLNPFLKEIWYIGQTKTIMAARDGYLRVANQHPQFDGMETTVERDSANLPIKATCKVWRKDRSHAITCEAFYNEYKKQSPVWNQYPSAMISKVAEVLALKRSFAINGVVTEEEIGYQPVQQAEAISDPEREALLSKCDELLNLTNFSEEQKQKAKKKYNKFDNAGLRVYIEKLKTGGEEQTDPKLSFITDYLVEKFAIKQDRQDWLRTNTEGKHGSLATLTTDKEAIYKLFELLTQNTQGE